jgi:hypothetical protein
MATSFTGLSEAQLDDKIVGAIQAALPYFDLFSTRLEPMEGDGGIVIGNDYIVPVVGDVTVADKTPGTLATPSGSVSGVPVRASSFKAAAFEAIEGSVSARLMAAWWGEQVTEAVRAVAASVVNAALDNLTESNYGTGAYNQVVEALADVDADTIQAIREYAAKKLKGKTASLICAPSLGSRLMTIGQVVYAYGIADKENVVKSGLLPDTLIGHRAFEYVDFPDNSENLVGAVVAKSAIAIVAGAPSQLIGSGQGEVVYRRIIEEPDSGLSLQYTEAVSAGGKVTGEVAVAYGTAKAQNAAVLIATA